MSSKEKKKGTLSPVLLVGGVEIRLNSNVKDRPTRQYTFNHVFNPYDTQETVHNMVAAPVIQDVVNGYNCTIFAYGMTGTGKTYSMEGERSNPNLPWDQDPKGGIIPRSIAQLFGEFEKMNSEAVLSVSYVELYNEDLFDLLVEQKAARPKLK
jgi:kinesin family protein 11